MDESSLRGRLVEELGDTLPAEWRQPFLRVPRHLFVPRFHDDGGWVDGSDPAQHDKWLEAVYSDRVLSTQWNDRSGCSTSSSEMPSMYAAFLRAAEIEDGMTVLEIGTGTGYLAALLAERLGSDRVTSIDIDPHLVEAARTCLATCGYDPLLAVADGNGGFPDRAPYDRLIATCSVPRIPEAWIRQVRPGGIIVAPLHGGRFEFGLVQLRVAEGSTAEGSLQYERASFMPMRTPEKSPAGGAIDLADFLAESAEAEAPARRVGVPGWMLDQDYVNTDFWWLFRVEHPDLEWVAVPFGEAAPDVLGLLVGPDLSWTKLVREDGKAMVYEHGPTALWARAEDVIRLFEKLGEPSLIWYQLRVAGDGKQSLAIEMSEVSRSWEL